MNKLLKIFCFCGLFCLWNCSKNSMHPNLINKKVCKQILVKNYFDANEYIINDDISIQELYELLQNATLCDIIKLPPRLVLTIKGTNYHQTFFICDDYIKDDKRKIYRCKKNIEKELKKIIKDNRSHNGLERSEWQAVYSENISRGQLNWPLRTYYITSMTTCTQVHGEVACSSLWRTWILRRRDRADNCRRLGNAEQLWDYGQGIGKQGTRKTYSRKHILSMC